MRAVRRLAVLRLQLAILRHDLGAIAHRESVNLLFHDNITFPKRVSSIAIRSTRKTQAKSASSGEIDTHVEMGCDLVS